MRKINKFMWWKWKMINEVIAAIGKGLNAEFGDSHLWQQLIAVIHSANAMSNIAERK